MITDEDKERVRQATDFFQLVSETVELRRRGSDWWGCCPFHHEKTPSFHINPATGLWKCFGCGLGGDVFDYVMKRENLEFPDAIRFLADRAGIELVEERGARRGPRRNRLIECLTEAESYYITILNRGRGAGPASGRSYLSGRGYGSEVCRRWGLGYAPGHAMLANHLLSKGFTRAEMEACDLTVQRNGHDADRFYERVMFPIHDEQGRTIAFGGRVLTDAKPKYLNTKETAVFHKGKHLFAFDRAKEHIAASGEAIVCEGYTDVIALHEAGFPRAVAALGTSFSMDHVRTLSRFAKRIVCMFDGDAAGQRAAERAVQFIDKSEADLRCVVLPNNQDPAEYLSTHRPQDLEEILHNAEPLMDFVLRKRLENVGPTAPGGVRMAALDEIAGILAPLRDSVLLDEYAMVVGDWLGIGVEEVKRSIRSKPVLTDGSTRWQSRSTARQNNASSRFSGGSSYAQGSRYDGYAVAEEDAYVPDDYVPYEAMEGVGSSYATNVGTQGESIGTQMSDVAFTTDERLQLRAERELLSLMAADPDAMREHADRIATFLWADERHEAMAWAMLATPENTPPADVVRAATEIVADAPKILSSGSVVAADGVDDRAKISFVLDTVELYSTRRKIKELRSQMRSGISTSENVFLEATHLQKVANELANRVASGFNNR
ncbi:MAG: DNA primase [Atopobiaceae bacterium]|nr:DNA primase [Atopobiaceae bacterium]